MSIKELFKNKMNLFIEDKAPTHLEMFKHHKDLEAAKWKERDECLARQEELKKEYAQAAKDGDKESMIRIKQEFSDSVSKGVRAAQAAREHNSNATTYHSAAQQSPDYKPEDFDYNPTNKSVEKAKTIQKEEPENIKQSEPIKAETTKQDINVNAKVDNNLSSSVKDREEAINQYNSHMKDLEDGFSTSDQYKAIGELKKKYPGIENKNSDFYKDFNADKSKIPSQSETPKQEPTTDANVKEPSAFENAKEQTKAPTEFKKAEPIKDEPKVEPKADTTEIKGKNFETGKEPSVLKGAKPAETVEKEAPKSQEITNAPKDNSHLTGGTKQLDQTNPLNKPQFGNQTKAPTENVKDVKSQQSEPKQAEVKQVDKQPQPNNSEELSRTAKQAEPNHPNIVKPSDTQPAIVNQQPSAPGTVAHAQPAPSNTIQPAHQVVQPTQIQTQPIQPVTTNPQPSVSGTVAPTPVVSTQSVPNHPNIVKPSDTQPEIASAQSVQPQMQNHPIDNSHLNGAIYKPDVSNPLNQFNGGINTGITTNQPSMIPSSGQFVNNSSQPVSNPVDHWANFKQSTHDAYGHLKNFAGQQYHNIKQNLGQHYQNIKQNASEHLNTAKQFATDHAHEIAGAGALGAAGLAAYAAYKHFKNKKKQPAPQPHQ